jgi:hypothetical protein
MASFHNIHIAETKPYTTPSGSQRDDILRIRHIVVKHDMAEVQLLLLLLLLFAPASTPANAPATTHTHIHPWHLRAATVYAVVSIRGFPHAAAALRLTPKCSTCHHHLQHASLMVLLLLLLCGHCCCCQRTLAPLRNTPHSYSR